MIKYILLSLFLVTYVKCQSQTLSFFSNSFTVTYTTGLTQTQFTISSTLDSTVSIANSWISIGFNSLQKMSGANAVICMNNGGATSVQDYKLTGYNSPVLLSSTSPALGLSSASVTVSGNKLTCTFTRDNSNSASGYFNILASQPYIIAAYGSTSGGAPLQHSGRTFTANTVAFVVPTTTPTTTTTRTTIPSTTTKTSIPSTTTPTTTKTSIPSTTTPTTTKTSTTIKTSITTAKTSAVSTTTTIPSSKTSFGNFTADGYVLEWTNGPLYTDFKFSHNLTTASRKKRDISVTGTGNIYIAFGLSNDDEMGDDSVCACRIFNNIGFVETYYNDPKAYVSVILNSNNRSIGISNQDIQFINNTLTCSFRRAKSLPGVDNYFDLSKNYYILIVTGASTQSGLTFHGEDHLVSNSIIDVQNNGTYTNSNQTNTIVQNIIQMIQNFFSAIYNFFQNFRFF